MALVMGRFNPKKLPCFYDYLEHVVFDALARQTCDLDPESLADTVTSMIETSYRGVTLEGE